MWKQSKRECTDGDVIKEDKQQVDTHVDSGFLSGSNLMSSELSIDLESEDQRDESDHKIAPEPVKAIDSGFNLGLTDSLNQLTLKEESTVNVDSGIINPDTEEFTSEEVKNDRPQESWEIYYTQDDDGDTQLHIAIVQGFLEAAFFLIGVAPNSCLLNILNDDAQSALHLAVLTHQPRIVRRLILAGADPTVRNFKGNTPLHVACASGDHHCAEALTTPLTDSERSWLQGKSLPIIPQNLEQRNYEGEMCLHIAAIKGHAAIVRQLLRLGADLEAREGLAGRTPLHLAIEHRQREVIHILVRECRPDLDAPTYAGLTAYHFACECDSQLAKELVRLGATPSVPPALVSDSDSDEDDDEHDENQETSYQMALSRLCLASITSQALASA